MGGLVTTPSRIFYNDSFVEEEDITNTEETLGSTLAPQSSIGEVVCVRDCIDASIHFHTLSR